MKFMSFWRLFGGRGSRKAPRGRSLQPRRGSLHLESLESRELLSGDKPFIRFDKVMPPDRSTTINPHPILQVAFSEDMVATEAADPANYFLFDSQNRPVLINGATYNNASFTTSL